jgi:sulfatase maturation enzyme AslB (radical SAM superfamily)
MIECKAKEGNCGSFMGCGENIFISANGDVTPCCWMGTQYGRSQIKNIPNIYEQDIETINAYNFDMENTDICQTMCGVK